MALFITFEGGEGCGKSVQARALYRRLSRLAIPAILTHEPGGTPLGRKLRRWLKGAAETEISPLAELLLFNASRAQLIADVIKPALENGQIVICDRYSDSTTAYQSYGRGLDLKLVTAINNAATAGIKPHLAVLLDMPPDEGLARKKTSDPDRFEQEDIVFHQRVRDGFLKLATAEPQRWLVVDAAKSQQEIAEEIWNRVSQLLPRQKRKS